MKPRLFICLAAFLISSLLFAAPAETPSKSGAPAEGKNLTSMMEDLGIPTEERFKGGFLYARNPWAMIDYKGRIYVGSGNSSNLGPGTNAGPVPILSLDPETKVFTKEWDVPDEQIDLFRVLSDGLLYIPGHDPKEGWELGNFYRKKVDGDWEKVGHVQTLIPRQDDTGALALTRKSRFREHETGKRGNRELKGNYGARHICVKGH